MIYLVHYYTGSRYVVVALYNNYKLALIIRVYDCRFLDLLGKSEEVVMPFGVITLKHVSPLLSGIQDVAHL
ncbi:MAG: hypothetical protein PUP92_24140 [Rhizonema sp. PD38]|nr:hypothetical protein [Rhizonema sp. PD38]